MPKLSARSERCLATAHPDLQKVFRKVAETEAIEIICGHRPKEEQDRAYREGHSRERWPNSRHNSMPSQAVDVCPLPIDFENLEPFKRLAKRVKEIAALMGVPLDWGGECWPHFRDYPHYQLARRH